MTGFTVIDKTTGEYPDCEKIALTEDWAKHLCYCDIDQFAIEEDGNLLLMDDCGKVAYCPHDRFEVVHESPWHTGTPTEEGWYLLAVKHGEKIHYNANRLYSGGEWFYSKLGEVLAYQKIEPYEASKEG